MSDAPGSVRVTHNDRNEIWIIALAGEHDLATARLLDAQTPEIWPRCSVAVVDLTAVTFIDSSVVNWLVRTWLGLEAQGVHDAIRIVEGQERAAIDCVFNPLAVRDAFPCYRTVPDAIAAAPARRLIRLGVLDGLRPYGCDDWQPTNPVRNALRET